MTSTTTERLTRAASHIDATDLGDGRWAYYADETRSWYVVSADELAELCDYLDDKDEQIAGDAYSHWCAGTSAEEMPSGWTPDDRDPVVAVAVASVREQRGERDELRAYVSVDVTVDGTSYPVGCVVGVPESQEATCRAAGGVVRPFLRAWWADSSDWAALPEGTQRAVREALDGHASALWRAVQAARTEVAS